MFVEDAIRNAGQLFPKLLAIKSTQRLATMLFEEATQDVVQQLACVDGLQIKRRFSARFQLQNTQTKEAISAVAIDAQPTRTVDKVLSESLVQQGNQIRVSDLAIVWTK